MNRTCVLLAILLSPGCGDDPRTGRISGQVSLAETICPPPPGDLQGNLVVITTVNKYGRLVEVASQVHSDVDLTAGPVNFQVDTPPGSYYLFAFLDDNHTFDVWPATEIGDPYGISGQAVTVETDREVNVNVELKRTLFSSNLPLVFTGVCGQEPFSEADRSCILEFIGDWVEDCYPMLGLRELDWDSVRAAYRAELDRLQNDKQLYVLLSRLLAELQDAHVWLAPTTSQLMMTELVGGEPGRLPGFSISFPDAQTPLVAGVDEESEAELLGLVPGDQLESVGGMAVGDLMDLWDPVIPFPNQQYHDFLISQALLVHPLSTPVDLQGRHADQTQFSITLQPQDLRTPVEGLPIEYQSISTPGGLSCGHLMFHAFSGDAYDYAGLYGLAMSEVLESQALIFDLRGNSGGSMTNLHTVLSILFDQPMHLLHYRSHHADPEPHDILTLDPVPPVVTQPLVLLIDGSCYSTCNLFAQIIQETGRGLLIGRPTGGGNSSPVPVQLSETLAFHIPALYLTTATGVDGEVDGIQPDVAVPLTRDDIQSGGYSLLGDHRNDTLLSRALNQIDSGL